MSTETHDDQILESVRWAKSLGYKVGEYNLGTETGADAIFENLHSEKVVLEIVTGSSFKKLLRKERIKKTVSDEFVLGFTIVGHSLDHLKDHGVEVGLSPELFELGHEKQRFFGVRTLDFRAVIPVLLVSILGTRGSPKNVRLL